MQQAASHNRITRRNDANTHTKQQEHQQYTKKNSKNASIPTKQQIYTKTNNKTPIIQANTNNCKKYQAKR